MKKSVKKTEKNFLSTIKPKKKNLVYWILGVVVLIVLFYLISGSINISVKDKETGELKKESLRGVLFSGDPGYPAGFDPNKCTIDDNYNCKKENPLLPICRETEYGKKCEQCIYDSDCTSNTDIPDRYIRSHCSEPEDEGKGIEPYLCRECLNNDHCISSDRPPSSNKVCYIGNCVECVTNNECRSGDKSVCANNHCVECTENIHCNNNPRSRVCDTNFNRCVECVDSGDCNSEGGKPHCKASTQTCVECLDDGDCSANILNTMCDRASGQCTTVF